jgi:ATP-binding protein involved in chromosome partitioning
VVSTPQDVAIADTIKGLKMFQQVNIPILGMVENMSYFAPEDSDKTYYIFGKDGVKKAAENYQVSFLGGVPLEMRMRESSDNGIPYMADEKNKARAGWKSYIEIAENVVKILGDEKKGIFKKFFK